MDVLRRSAPDASGLLERESDLAALESVVASAAAGSGRIGVIDGAAGIGKSALLRETCARARARGAGVMVARGSELERAFAFGVVRQLFDPVVGHIGAHDLEWAFDGAARLSGRLFGVADGTARDGGDAEPFAVLHGLYWLTVNLAERQPRLLAIDDLHWGDPASLRWIAFLAHRMEGLPVALIATVRPLEADADPALAELLVDPATLAVRPAPLTLQSATVIVADRLPSASVDVVAPVCHEVTGGNPLLLREVVNALASVDLPAQSHEIVATVRGLAPEVVSRRVNLELAKLGSDARRLATAVAVLGDDVELHRAADVAGLDEGRARIAAGLLTRAELLGRDGFLRFNHPLLRSAVYTALPSAERETLHERAASSLANASAPVDHIAAQLLLAPTRASASAVRTLREAAASALRSGASESAVAYLRRALAEPPPDIDRADVLLELSAAEARIGAAEGAERLREALTLLDDPVRRARAHLALARTYLWFGQDERAMKQAEIALAEPAATDPALRRTFEAEYLAAALRVPAHHQVALARLRRLPVAASDDAGSQMLRALKAYGDAYEGERLDEAVDLAERALVKGMPSDEAPSWAHWGAVSTLLIADQFETCLRVVDQTLAQARRRGAVYLFSGASMVRASILHARGALAEAEADARGAVEALPGPGAMILSLTHGVLARVLVERGDLLEAASVLDAAGADSNLEPTFATIPLLEARANLRRAQGHARAAAADALACRRAAAAVGFRNPGASWSSEAVLALLADGAHEQAQELAQDDLARARRWGAPRALGRALRSFGLAAGGEDAIASLRDSVLVLERSPALLERALSLVELGAALRRRGRNIEARDRLRGGLELADRCGARPLSERAHQELIAAGARPRSRALVGTDSLTPSERRIAGMAAEGMTNRQIAQALFVTPRAVEMHLSNSFRKLDIKSRTQLPKSLVR